MASEKYYRDDAEDFSSSQRWSSSFRDAFIRAYVRISLHEATLGEDTLRAFDKEVGCKHTAAARRDRRQWAARSEASVAMRGIAERALRLFYQQKRLEEASEEVDSPAFRDWYRRESNRVIFDGDKLWRAECRRRMALSFASGAWQSLETSHFAEGSYCSHCGIACSEDVWFYSEDLLRASVIQQCCVACVSPAFKVPAADAHEVALSELWDGFYIGFFDNDAGIRRHVYRRRCRYPPKFPPPVEDYMPPISWKTDGATLRVDDDIPF